MQSEPWRPEPPYRYSRLKYLELSPLHFRWACTAPDVDTVAKRKGRATHALVYEPHKFDERYIHWPGDRRKKGYKDFAAEHEAAGFTVLTTNELDEVSGIAKGVWRHPEARRLLEDPWPAVEKRIQWTDKRTGLELAGTPDFVASAILDLKTTGQLPPRLFAAYAARAGYHGQVAMYGDGLEALGAIKRPVYWLAVESQPPYDCIPYEVGDEVLDRGRAKYNEWLDKLQRCLETGEWPGMSPGIMEFALPGWATADAAPIELEIGGERLVL